MGKPYSVDLRMAVVRSIEAGCTREEAAELHGVSLSSVGRFLRPWRSRGNVRAAATSRLLRLNISSRIIRTCAL